MEIYVKLEFCLYILLCLKRNFMYANSAVVNCNVPNSIVIPEEITTTEGCTLILTCPTSSSGYTIWDKSRMTSPCFTTYADGNQIDPSIEHANRLRVVGNFSIGIYNLQILNVSLVDEGLYRCSYTNNTIGHNKEIRVSLKNSPEVVILEGSTLTITEDKELRLTCKVDCSSHIKSMSWSMMDKKTMFNLYESNSTLVIPKVNRNNSGVYICHAETKVGKGTANISVTIQYPPDVNVIAVTSHFGKTRLDCLARGVPTSYTFSRWEHKSTFGEHIRYLDGLDNGTLLIQNKSKLKSYQDNGVYVCHVTNGVLNSNGSVIQMGEYVLKVESQPVFAMQTKRTQFGVDGQTASLIFHLCGYQPVKEVFVFVADDKTERIQINEIKIKNATVLYSFHGVVIHAIGYTINFEFGRLSETDFRNYTIIAYNSVGKGVFDFEIIPAPVEEYKSSGSVVLLVSVVAGVAVFLILTIFIYRMYLKKKENESASRDVEEFQIYVVDQGIGPVENALYQSRNPRSSATYSTMEGRGKSHNGHSVVSYSTAESDINADIFSGGATNLHSTQPSGDLVDKDIGLSLSATGYNTPKDLLREQGHLQARQEKRFDNKELQYSELSFNSSSGPRFIIHGKDKKTAYSDVDLSIRVSPLPSTDSDSDSDDNDDFMYVDNIKKYTKKRSTRVKLNTK